jgi:signal peptidase
LPKTILKIWNALTTLLVIAAVLLAVLLAGVRVVGLTPFAVLSGSMEPTYHVGSIIYVQKTAPENIKVGDPISFVLNEDLQVATHRVVEIDAVNQRFYTKGDANNAPDAVPVHFKNLLGKPLFTIPRLGYVSSFLSTTKGMILAGTAALVLLILVFVPDMLNAADKADKKSAKAKSRD